MLAAEDRVDTGFDGGEPALEPRPPVVGLAVELGGERLLLGAEAGEPLRAEVAGGEAGVDASRCGPRAAGASAHSTAGQAG